VKPKVSPFPVATGAAGGVVVGGVVVGGVVAGGVVVGGTVGAVVAAATVNDALSWLFDSLDSVIRLTSSTKAFTVWFPAVAGHVALDEPPLAVKVTEAPGAKDAVSLALHVYGVALPSTVKRTPMIVPAGVAVPPWFFTVAENVTGVPAVTDGLSTLVTTRSAGAGAAATVNDVLSWLLDSLDSVIRFTSSTHAWTLCVPAVAAHVAPDEPPLAVNVTDAPGVSDVVSVSLHVYGVLPSTVNRTPMIFPAGVAAVPWFFTVAVNFTAAPGATAGFVTLVTTRSGAAVAADADELATVVKAAPAKREAASVAATPAMGFLIFLGRVLRDADVSIRVSSLSRKVVVVGPRLGDSGHPSTRLMRNAAPRVEKARLGHRARELRWSIRAGRQAVGPNLRDRDAARVAP
jgi:hypothetical protein